MDIEEDMFYQGNENEVANGIENELRQIRRLLAINVLFAQWVYFAPRMTGADKMMTSEQIEKWWREMTDYLVERME